MLEVADKFKQIEFSHTFMLLVQTKLSFSQALFSSQKILQIFSNSPSHQIFRRIYEVLNINENKN